MRHLVREFKHSLRRFGLILTLMFFLFYIGYHTISGDRGLRTWMALSQKIEVLKEENKTLQANVDALQKDVDQLSMENPDIDYLDELSRSQLGVAYPFEKIIIIPQGAPEPDLL